MQLMNRGIRRPLGRLFSCLISLLLAVGVSRGADPGKTLVSDVVYRADGTPAAGTLLITWPAFTTADNKAVAAGSLSVTIGPAGAVNIQLVPNEGATPDGSYYKVVLKLNDGSTSTEYWTVPAASPTTIAAIRATVVPASVAAQLASRSYVDQAVAAAVLKTGDQTIAGVKQFTASPLVPDPTLAQAAASKQYVDLAVAAGSGGTGPLALSKGGTGQTTWTPGRCVRSSNDGTKLESAAADCGSGSGSGNATQLQGKPLDTTIGSTTTPGSIPVLNPAGTAYAAQTKPLVDVRDYGAACDETTDDTDAIQKAINVAATGTTAFGQATRSGTVLMPVAGCRITRQLMYEGTTGTSLHFRAAGYAARGSNPRILWCGPKGATMFLMLGANNSSVEGIHWQADCTGGAVPVAAYGVWTDSSNTLPATTTWTISSISRDANGVVTVTTTAPHDFTVQQIAKIENVSGDNGSFNGIFHVLAVDSATTFKYIQGGAATSGSGGTAKNYKSAIASGNVYRHLIFSNPDSQTAAITSATGTNPITVTTSTMHYLNPGDPVIISGATNTSYNGAWQVQSITSSTVAVLVPLPGSTQLNANGAGASDGTLQGGSAGLAFSHSDALTPQVDSVIVEHVRVQGRNNGINMVAFRAFNGGNTKNFSFSGVQPNGVRYGFYGFISGLLNVRDLHGSLFGDTGTTSTWGAAFIGNHGQIQITGAEMEDTGAARFFVSTATPNNLSLGIDALSWQSTAPADDIVIQASNLRISDSSCTNNRTGASVCYLSAGGYRLGVNGNGSLVSQNTFYKNASGYIPVKDSSGNVFQFPGGFLTYNFSSICSLGDHGGGAGGGQSAPLTPICGLSTLEIGNSTDPISTTGSIRMTRAASIKARNQANTADLNLLSVDSADVTQVGDAAGIFSNGNVNISGQYQINGTQLSSFDLGDSPNLPRVNIANIFTAAGGITLDNQRGLRLRELSGNGTDYIEIRGPSSLAAPKTLTWNAQDCSGNANGGALTVDASGNINCSDDDGGAGGTDTRVAVFSGGTQVGSVARQLDYSSEFAVTEDTANDQFDIAVNSISAAKITTGTLANARLDSDLQALGDNAANGLWARTGPGTGAARSLTGTANFNISNPDGVSGNPGIALTLPVYSYFAAAGCAITTAASSFDLPASNAPTANCLTGSNTQQGTLDFDDASSRSAQVSFMLPDDWTGAIDADLYWLVTSGGGSNSVTWTVYTACTATAASYDTAFNPVQNVPSGVGANNALTKVTQAAITTTGCSAGNWMHIKIGRDVTDTFTGTARLVGLRLKLRRLI